MGARSLSRWSCTLLALLGILLANRAGAWTQTKFMIGTYWDPYVSNNPAAPNYADSAAVQADVATFNVARAAYFNLITGKSNYSAASQGNACHLGTKTALTDYLLYLGSRTGMYVMPSDNRFHRIHFYNVDSAAAITQRYLNLDAARRSVFYGYNVRDEPGYLSSATATMCGGSVDPYADDQQNWAAYFRNNDTSRLAYINFYPRGWFPSDACFEAYLDDFLNPSDPTKALDVASFDNYPFATTHANGIDPTYFYNLATVRKKAGTRAMWAYPLVIEHSDYVSPSDEHFRFMAFCPIAYGAKGLVYFTYVLPNCPGNQDACPDTTNPFCSGTAVVTGSSTPTAKYNKVKTVNHFITNLAGPMVIGSTWLGAYHKSSAPSTEVMRPEWLVNANRTPIVSDLSDSSSLVGVFRSGSSATVYYLLVVNKNLASKTTTVTLKGNHTGNVMLAPTVVGYTGDTTYTAASTSYSSTTNKTTFTLSLAGGEARLVRIKSVTNLFVATMRTDYDGDGKADLSVRTDAGSWQIDYSKNGFGSFDVTRTGTGGVSDARVPGDYDGDGLADIGVLLNTGTWQIDHAANGFGTWDVTAASHSGTPTQWDWDNDDRVDMAVSNSGQWKVDYAANGFTGWDATYSGYTGYGTNYESTAGDFDGDGKADVSGASWNNYNWKIDYSANGFTGWQVTRSIPLSEDFKTAAADYDGDGKTDIGVYNFEFPAGSNNKWYIDYAHNGFGTWGTTFVTSGSFYGSVPVPADYDGDGKADISLKTDAGDWKIDYASNGFGSWDVTYTGYGGSTSRPMFRVQEAPAAVFPDALSLSAAPNPFGDGTTISYLLTRAGRVEVAIYTVAGARVRTLLAGEKGAGHGQIEWEGSNQGGRRLPPGIYFCRLEAEGRTLTRKLVLKR